MLELLITLTQGCVMVVRRYKTNIASSSYNGIIKVINKYNLNQFFKIKKSPLQIQCLTNGYTIDFAGLDSPDKLKSAEAPVGSYKLLVFEEAQEIPKRELCDEVISTFERGEGSDGFRSLWIFNPPPNKNHWTNLELRNDIAGFQKSLQVNYNDIPLDWVGKQQLKEIERVKANNPKLYKYRYKGYPIAAEDVVFENIYIKTIDQRLIDKWETDDDYIFNGLDFGYKPDKNAAISCHYDYENRILYLYREFYKGELNNKQISDGLEAAGFDMSSRITADSAEPKTIADLKSYGWYVRPTVKGKGSVEAGFKWLQGLTAIIIDRERCPNAAIEFEEYHYEIDRDGGISENKLYKWDQSDHTIAAVRYALENLIRKAGV